MISTKKQNHVFYTLLVALTLFATLAHINIAFRIFLYSITIASPLLFDDTKTISMYFYGICFKGAFGSTASFWVALSVSILVLEIKKLYLAIKTKQYVKEISSLYILWGIIIGVFTVYSLIFNHFRVYRMVLVDFAQCIIAFLLVRKTIDIKTILLHLFSGIVASVLAGSIFNMFNITNPYVAGDISSRYGGFFGKINTLALYCTLCTSCFISLILTEHLELKKYCCFPILSTLVGLLSYSKAFILVVGLLYISWYILSFIKYKNNKRFLLYSIGLFVTLVALMFVAQNYIKIMIDRFINSSSTSVIDTLTTGRSEIWKAYLKKWLNSPLTFLFGNGHTSTKLFVNKSEHSTYVALLYQLGVVGTIALIALIVTTIRKYSKLSKNIASYIPLCVLLVYGLVEALSGGLYTSLVWFVAFYFITPIPNRHIANADKGTNKQSNKNEDDTSNDIKNEPIKEQDYE